ncbi:MAG TPA: hypothetical protein VF401_03795 [Candidatus Saccharimonadales bacterium]
MKYPRQAAELIDLLAQDQAQWKEYAKAEFIDKLSDEKLQALKHDLRKSVAWRGRRALQILGEIKDQPSLDAIGSEAATALSVLATHDSLEATKRVLAAFEACYRLSTENTQAASIPAMVDWIAVLEHRPQTFGTIWLFDDNDFPFLPVVEDFANINTRRERYSIGPLKWPKSMAIPEEDQLWLKQPIEDAIMRAPTKAELQKLSEFY